MDTSRFLGQPSSSSSDTEINYTKQLKQRKCSVPGCGSTDHDKRNCQLVKSNQNRQIIAPTFLAKNAPRRKSNNATETIGDDLDNEDIHERTETQQDNYNNWNNCFSKQRISQWGSQWVMQMMRSTRFEDILACLHWTNTVGISQREKDAKSKQNCYWSIQGFLDGMAERCMALFNPGQKLDVDESCFSFLGLSLLDGLPLRYRSKSQLMLSCSSVFMLLVVIIQLS